MKSIVLRKNIVIGMKFVKNDVIAELAKFLLKIGNRAIVEEIVGDDIVPEVFIERIRTPGGDMTPGDGKVDGDIGGDEHFVTLTETSNMA